MLYFTGDLHFGDAGVCRDRKMFASTDEMDAVLTENWNRRVTEDDTVVIVGDLFNHPKRPVEEYLSALRGKKVLVRGNHDENWLAKTDAAALSRCFTEVRELFAITKGDARLKFCHYPMIAWANSGHGSVLICGHIHDKDETHYEYGLFRQLPFAFNAGADINGLSPVPLSELIANNERFYKRNYTPEQRQYLATLCRAVEE